MTDALELTKLPYRGSLRTPQDTEKFAPSDTSYFALPRGDDSASDTPLSTPGTAGAENIRFMKPVFHDPPDVQKRAFHLNPPRRKRSIHIDPLTDKYTLPAPRRRDVYKDYKDQHLRKSSVASASSGMTDNTDEDSDFWARDRDPSISTTATSVHEPSFLSTDPYAKNESQIYGALSGRSRSLSAASRLSESTVFDADADADGADEDEDPKSAAGAVLEEEHIEVIPPVISRDYARARPRRPLGSIVEQQNGSSEEYTSESDTDELDLFSEEEEPPYVPPAFEDIDPQIPVVEPDARSVATVSEPLTKHAWTTPPYNVVERPAPVVHRVRAAIKVSASLVLVFSLLVGYGLRLKIVSVGPWSFGMYGLLLTVDFIVQTIAASFNRRRVNKLTRESPIMRGCKERVQIFKDTGAYPETCDLPEATIAVVGYREDEDAWMNCLKSLQAQEYPIKHIIGVVDGQDKPDLDMADAFGKAFQEHERLIINLPVLLSVIYKDKYWETIKTLGYPELTRWQLFKMWFTQDPRPGQDVAHEIAWNHMLDYLWTKSQEERWHEYRAICFAQPHGHKRHAMFTAFVVGAYVMGTKDAMLTTDSDTYVHTDAVSSMMTLLFSDKRMAGVTGDVRIWNKSESFLALMSSLRYWFAFNVERACQSAFGCVGCLSGPLGLYKTSDLMSVLGPWILQSFLGKETTFGDDRHLTNRILSLGHKTGYTHLAMCDSDTPAGYVRWVKQQTRWSKSFFREAFWFPKSFVYHDAWLTIETTKQFLYPMILTATVVRMLYTPSYWARPIIWLGTMVGVALIKSIYGVVCMRDWHYFLFGIYGFMYFFGLLPSKLFACFTVGITTWGTSARSKSEFARPESFYSRTTHVGHLVAWYMSLSIGLGYFLSTVLNIKYLWALSALGLPAVYQCYADTIIGESKYFYFVMRKKWRARRQPVSDVEKAIKRMEEKKRFRDRFRHKRSGSKGKGVAEARTQIVEVPAIMEPASTSSTPPQSAEASSSVRSLPSISVEEPFLFPGSHHTTSTVFSGATPSLESDERHRSGSSLSLEVGDRSPVAISLDPVNQAYPSPAVTDSSRPSSLPSSPTQPINPLTTPTPAHHRALSTSALLAELPFTNGALTAPTTPLEKPSRPPRRFGLPVAKREMTKEDRMQQEDSRQSPPRLELPPRASLDGNPRSPRFRLELPASTLSVASFSGYGSAPSTPLERPGRPPRRFGVFLTKKDKSKELEGAGLSRSSSISNIPSLTSPKTPVSDIAKLPRTSSSRWR